MVVNQDIVRTRVMAKAIADSGHELSSPWVLEATMAGPRPATNVFTRDSEGVEESEAIVADVSKPSTGVGMEIMAAHFMNKRVIIVVKRGSVVSRMVTQMEPKETVEFNEDTDLYGNLRRTLEAASCR